MNTAHRLLPFIILLFGALAIWGRINREIVRQVRAEELRTDLSILQLRDRLQERADKALRRTLYCGLELKWCSEAVALEDKRLESERQNYLRLPREFDEISKLREERR